MAPASSSIDLATRRRQSSRSVRWPAALVLTLIVGGCGAPVDQQGVRDVVNPGLPSLTRPLVERDLPQLRSAGVLRMVTRYNSSSCYIDKGGHAGFEYDLIARFAREQRLALEVIVPEPGEDVLNLINSGRADVLALGSALPDEVAAHLAASRPYNFSGKVLVLPEGRDRGEAPAALSGLTIHVPYRSAERELLRELKERSGLSFFAVSAGPLVESEELIARVAGGQIEATVADENLARAAACHLEGLQIGPSLSPSEPVCCHVRANSPLLLSALNEYLASHLKVTPDGPRRSRFYGLLYARYYEGDRQRPHPGYEGRPERTGSISPWDRMIRDAAGQAGVDWRLVAALCFQESRFDPGAVSNAGAVGLMQVLPRFAGEAAEQLHDPGVNLRVGTEMLRQIHDGYRYLPEEDRLAFTLATYHAGIGHMNDARRLAMDSGRDPNRWRRSLDQVLPRLMEQRWYSQTRHGFYRGAETVQYVQAILDRYRMYRRLLPEPAEVAAFAVTSQDPQLEAAYVLR
jgi:membrane-bound lytic murein transglycosylase F